MHSDLKHRRGGKTCNDSDFVLFSGDSGHPTTFASFFCCGRGRRFSMRCPTTFLLKASCQSTCILVSIFYSEGHVRDHILRLGSAVVHVRFPCGRTCNGKVAVLFDFIGTNRVCDRRIRLGGQRPRHTLSVG